jgi:hypothetical protein
MSWTRRFAVVTCLVIAAGSVLTIARVPAGAVKLSKGTVVCKQFGSSTNPPNPVSWTLSGCNRPAVTGGSGTPVQTSQTTEGTTLVIDWSAGNTTTIFLSSHTTQANPRGCHFHNGGPHVSQEAYVQPGSVTADTTGFIKASNFTVSMCFQQDNLTGGQSSTWNSKRFKF